MFGIDAPELLIIAVVALVVIGPKELPGMLRSIGRWMSQMRMMASEFRGHVDDMVRQSELDEIKKSVQDIKDNTVLDLQALDPTKEIKEAIASGEADANKTVSDINQALAAPEPLPPVQTADVAPVTGAESPPADPALPAPNEQQAAVPLELVPPLEPLPVEPLPVAVAEPAPAPAPTKSAA